MGVSKSGWFMENPMNMDDLGVIGPHFRKPPHEGKRLKCWGPWFRLAIEGALDLPCRFSSLKCDSLRRRRTRAHLPSHRNTMRNTMDASMENALLVCTIYNMIL